tara:strand:- start:243 stop:494 length:252 start_codon:yes stop_codon:yes gene_type:complete
MKKKPSEKDIIKIICKILKMNSNSLVKIDNYTKMKNWDSLAQLDIISALDKKLDGQLGKIKNIAEIKSVKKIISILKKKSLIL